jgi:protein phosphatase
MWATQGEGWIRQLALGLNALHEHKLVFGFQAKDVLMHVSVMEKDQVSWKRLMDLQPSSAPAQACSDVQALASAILSMPADPLKSNQPLKALLERARQPAVGMTADQLVSQLNDLAFNPPREHVASRDATDAPLSAASKYSYAAKTDKGRMRDGNEDSLLAIGMHISNDNVTYQPLLLAVSDGMGGEDAGEIASQLTLKELHKAVTQIVTNDEEIEPKVWVQRTIKQINERVLETARKLGNQMGATLVFAFVHDGTACLGNVGDSRIYRWNAKRNGGQMVRLVKDHSLVQRLVDLGEIKDPDRYAHPERNMVLRSIGDPKNARSDDNEPVPIYAGDWLLLCSDGLWEMVRDDQIRDVLAGSRTPEEACDRLVDMANANGGEDNIAVVIARFE